MVTIPDKIWIHETKQPINQYFKICPTLQLRYSQPPEAFAGWAIRFFMHITPQLIYSFSVSDNRILDPPQRSGEPQSMKGRAIPEYPVSSIKYPVSSIQHRARIPTLMFLARMMR